MGLFGFLKPNARSGFNLKPSDFDDNTVTAKVLSVKLSDDFYDLFPDAGKPGEPGEILKVQTRKTSVNFWGKPVEITFDPVFAADLAAFVKKINEQLTKLNAQQQLVNEAIITDLLTLKNNSWLSRGQPAVTAESFLNAIQLYSISFIEDTAMVLYYDDGELFDGHNILVEIDAKGNIGSVSIAG